MYLGSGHVFGGSFGVKLAVESLLGEAERERKEVETAWAVEGVEPLVVVFFFVC